MYDITMKQQYSPCLPYFYRNFLKHRQTSSCVQLQSFKTTNYPLRTHPLWEDRLEADDQPVILVPGTTLPEATVERVSSDLHPCRDPYHTVKLIVSE